MYDYCVDDPVSQRDPTGLIAPLLLTGARWVVKKAAKKVVDYFFNKNLNEPEEMMDVRQQIMEVEERLGSGAVTEEDKRLLDGLRTREDELWNQYGEHYGKEPYTNFFPDPDYVERKRRGIK